MNSIRIAVFAMASVISFGIGYRLSQVWNKCPDCVCPSIPKCPDYQLQSIDIDKIKGVRGFTLNQTFQVKLDSLDLAKIGLTLCK